MRFVFRADASPEIGSGHAMRCSAIVEQANAIGIDTVFVGSLGGIGWLEDRFLAIGCRVIPPSDFQGIENVDILILDSYVIQSGDEFLLEWNWKSRVILVDSASPVQNADLLIHPGLSIGWFNGDRDRLLYGPKYIPFRNSIVKNQKELPPKLQKLVVFGGGTDMFNFAYEISKILSELEDLIEVVFFSHAKKEIEQIDKRFKVLPFGQRLDEELHSADLVFTTASTSSLEIVAREIPLGVACAVENQREYYDALFKAQVAAQLGERFDSTGWRFNPESIYSLVKDSEVRRNLRTNSHNFLDLKGAERIVAEILAL